MIHRFQMGGKNIVMDINSGAVHVTDECTYDLLSLLGEETFIAQEQCPVSLADALSARYSREEVEEAYSEIKELTEQGLLYTKDTYAELAKNWNKRSYIKAMCLHVAHDCNLRCKYCFASTGSFEGKRSIMELGTAKKAIDFLIASSGQRRNLEVDFFGGEPLMALDTVKETVRYAREQEKKFDKNFRFTITTNGILLDDETDRFINEEMSNVVLSIDGRKEINDAMRGKGVYDKILPRFKKLADERGQTNYYVRGTFTAKNLDFANDVLHLADLGFLQTSVEPVVEEEPGHDYELKREHLPQIFAEYERLAYEYVKRRKEGRGFQFFHFMVDLNQGPCIVKRMSGCGAGHEYVAVTPEGDIYPCHQFVGNPDFAMGNVYDGTIDESLKKKFECSNVYTKKACEHCFAKFYCSGGCSANAYKFNGDIDIPYDMACEMERKRTECAIYIAAEAACEEDI